VNAELAHHQRQKRPRDREAVTDEEIRCGQYFEIAAPVRKLLRVVLGHYGTTVDVIGAVFSLAAALRDSADFPVDAGLISGRARGGYCRVAW
jgi:hypothetical protein